MTTNGKFQRLLQITSTTNPVLAAGSVSQYEWDFVDGGGRAILNSSVGQDDLNRNVFKTGERFIIKRIRCNINGVDIPRVPVAGQIFCPVFLQVKNKTSGTPASEKLRIQVQRSEDWQDVNLFIELTDFSDPDGYYLEVSSIVPGETAVLFGFIDNFNVQDDYIGREMQLVLNVEVSTPSQLELDV